MKLKLLLVDNTEMIRNAIAEYLEDIGHLVDTAKNATSAMELIESNVYDIIITDLCMPDLGYDAESGLYLLKYIKRHLPNVEVIVMSGDPCIETSLTAIKYGAFYFFSKPFSLEALKDKIEIIRNMKLGCRSTASHATG
jgi:DNA-binding NtrC family response regulator